MADREQALLELSLREIYAKTTLFYYGARRRRRFAVVEQRGLGVDLAQRQLQQSLLAVGHGRGRENALSLKESYLLGRQAGNACKSLLTAQRRGRQQQLAKTFRNI